MNTVVWEPPRYDAGHQASGLSPEDREFVINKLAEMLVAEYQLDQQQNQAVTEVTVKEPPALDRKPSAFKQTPDPYAGRRHTGSIEQLSSTWGG